MKFSFRNLGLTLKPNTLGGLLTHLILANPNIHHVAYHDLLARCGILFDNDTAGGITQQVDIANVQVRPENIHFLIFEGKT